MGGVVMGDARELSLRPRSVDAVVTSVPYLRQRRYGDHPLEIGTETTLAAYVFNIAAAFDDLVATGPDGEPLGCLKPEAAVWLNIGDKANGSGGAGGDWNRTKPDGGLLNRHQKRHGDEGPGRFHDRLYREGSYLDVPGAVIHELISRGWRLRMSIVWDKGREAPEDLRHVRRPRMSHEMIYLLVHGRRPTKKKKTPPAPVMKWYPSMLRETGSVWHFPPGGDGPSHLAPFPDELAERCILPTTLPGDLVLDPFDGSGTVRRVAGRLGRRAFGVELYAGQNSATPGLGGFTPGRRGGTPRQEPVEATA